MSGFRKWTKRPTGRLEVDHQAFSKPLLWAFLLPNLENLTKRGPINRLINQGMTNDFAFGMRGLRGDASGEYLESDNNITAEDYESGITFVLVWAPDSPSTGLRIFGTDTNFEYVRSGTLANDVVEMWSSGANCQYTSAVAGILRQDVITVSRPDGTNRYARIYSNNDREDTSNDSNAVVIGAAKLMIGARPGDTTDPARGTYYMFAAFDGMLTDNENLSLSNNPWQIFKRKSFPTYATVADRHELLF